MNPDDRAADGGPVDWDAAFEALVAPLRPSRRRWVARSLWYLVVALVFMSVACWAVIRLVAEPLGELGRPWM